MCILAEVGVDGSEVVGLEVPVWGSVVLEVSEHPEQAWAVESEAEEVVVVVDVLAQKNCIVSCCCHLSSFEQDTGSRKADYSDLDLFQDFDQDEFAAVFHQNYLEETGQ